MPIFQTVPPNIQKLVLSKSVKPTDKPDSVSSRTPESARKVTAINLGRWSPNGSVLPTRQLWGPHQRWPTWYCCA
jgi:hypothetical protein